MTIINYFPSTLQQYYGTLWPSSQFKLICSISCQHLTNTSICTDGRESSSQSDPWTAHPNISKSFSFKFTGVILWQSISTFHEKINFSHIFVNALSLIPVTVYIACNELNAQRPKRSKETTVPLSSEHCTTMTRKSVFPSSCGFADSGAMIRMSSSRTHHF